MIGTINLRGKPTVLSGTRDTAALALGIVGLVAAGPLMVLFPDAVARQLQSPFLIWAILLLLYTIVAGLISLLQAPSLVVYNVSSERIRPMLGSLLDKLDGECRWAGECVALPGLGIQFSLNDSVTSCNVVLKSVGTKQSHSGWKKMERELRKELRLVPTPVTVRGVGIFSLGTSLVLSLGISLLQNYDTVVRSLNKFF